jgi:hypothetical protein
LYWHFYAISNRHVINGKGTKDRIGSPVVRLNKHDGQHDVIPLTIEDWTFTEHDDSAVAPISYNEAHKYLFVSVIDKFLTKENAAKNDIGIGDEVFMVGRLVRHDGGQQRNIPSIRWGHVSMMPFENVDHPSNSTQEQESFLVEVHSVSGYSGSPVFVRPFVDQKMCVDPYPSRDESDRGPWPSSAISGNPTRLSPGPWLLGVDWGYINNHDQSLNNTGVSAVVPAWRLIDLLNTEKLKMLRAQEQKEREEKKKEMGVTLTSHDD